MESCALSQVRHYLAPWFLFVLFFKWNETLGIQLGYYVKIIFFISSLFNFGKQFYQKTLLLNKTALPYWQIKTKALIFLEVTVFLCFCYGSNTVQLNACVCIVIKINDFHQIFIFVYLHGRGGGENQSIVQLYAVFGSHQGTHSLLCAIPWATEKCFASLSLDFLIQDYCWCLVQCLYAESTTPDNLFFFSVIVEKWGERETPAAWTEGSIHSLCTWSFVHFTGVPPPNPQRNAF